MTKKIWICVLALILSVSLFAQNKERPNRMDAEQRADRMTEVLKGKLELNDEQVVQMQAIQLDAQLKYDEIKGLKSTDKELFVKKQTNLIKDIDSRILMILSEEQSTTYHALAARERNEKATEERLRNASKPQKSN